MRELDCTFPCIHMFIMVFPGMAARILFTDEGARLYFSLYTFVHHGVPGHGGQDTLHR
jgi:hypothetical protein